MLTIIRGRIIIFSKDRLWFLFFPLTITYSLLGTVLLKLNKNETLTSEETEQCASVEAATKSKGLDFSSCTEEGSYLFIFIYFLFTCQIAT